VDLSSSDYSGLIVFVIGLVVVLFLAWLVWKLIGIRIIGSSQVGVVEKWWSPRGSLKDKIIALNGEAGYQPDVLRAGLHFKSPFMFRVHTYPLVTIPQGAIGYIFARDGIALAPQQTLGKVIDCDNFQDTRAFLTGGGQKGPQRAILREGTYAFNLAQFIVLTEQGAFYHPLGDRSEQATIQSMGQQLNDVGGFAPVVIRDADDLTGVVTVTDGPSLPTGDIIAPTVGDKAGQPGYHGNFQDPEAFLAAGGFRGRQYHVLTEGTYFINRLFATVELIPKTIVEVGSVGVVVSYFGPKGDDVSGADYSHGELVAMGNRGVWNEALMPGKYAFNTYAGKVIGVPTTNIILKWIRGETGTHGYDQNLAEVDLITKDAFEPSLPLSVVIHIDYRKAPLVIQRFGDVSKLVNQTLDPMVAAYFKNIGQTKTLIELIQSRSDIQQRSSTDMKEKFERYNLELEEVLIGTPRGSEGDTRIENILTQLRDRQIAREQLETYESQRVAADKQRELEQSKATAAAQGDLTRSNINITVQENTGKAELAKSRQDADRVRTLASADADRIRMTAEANAEMEAKVGIGKAIATEEQVNAYGGPQFQLAQEVTRQLAMAIENGRIPLVPQTQLIMGGGEGGEGMAGGNVLTSLLSVLLTEKLTGKPITAQASAERTEERAAMDARRRAMRDSVMRTVAAEPSAGPPASPGTMGSTGGANPPAPPAPASGS
jgi:uncharacterized membrane protein YqiK